MANPQHALVFGASGITGWAVVNALLSGYPSPNTFGRVTALTNRPLSAEAAQWPDSNKLQLVSGVDLQQEPAALQRQLKQQVPAVDSVTIVYFFAYIMDPAPDKEAEVNVRILRNAVEAVEKLSPNLRFVVLPTGTKAYGVHLLDHFPWKNHLPLKETLPRLPEPHASNLFYYHQWDLLSSISQNKQWSFCTVMPDVIVGFVPNNNVFNLAQWLAIYLSLYREMHGEGAEVVFPGPMQSWTIQGNDSSQDIIARFAIHASLHPETASGEQYNCADHPIPSTWSTKWPILCEYFNLKGVAPTHGPGPDPAGYIAANREKWLEMEQKYGLRPGHAGREGMGASFFTYAIFHMLNFDRPLDLQKMREAWGERQEEVGTREAWYAVFDRFRRGRIIP